MKNPSKITTVLVDETTVKAVKANLPAGSKPIATYGLHARAPYPTRPPHLSVKKCLKCGTVQSRKIVTIGTYTLEEILNRHLEIKLPRVTGSMLWWIVFPVAMLVSPYWPGAPRGYYIVTESSDCPQCKEGGRKEKTFARQFGWFGILVNKYKAWRKPAEYSVHRK